MEEILFTETTTIGIRQERTGTDDPETPCREGRTSIGEAQVESVHFRMEKNAILNDSASALAGKADISFREAYDTIVNCWKTEKVRQQ